MAAKKSTVSAPTPALTYTDATEQLEDLREECEGLVGKMQQLEALVRLTAGFWITLPINDDDRQEQEDMVALSVTMKDLAASVKEQVELIDSCSLTAIRQARAEILGSADKCAPQ